MRRGQAALEYVFTYGYAFLAILIVLGFLSYYGVLNFTALQSAKCEFPDGVSCLDQVIIDTGADGNISMHLRNDFGTELEVIDMNVDSKITGLITNCGPYADLPMPTNWQDEEEREFGCVIPNAVYIPKAYYDFQVYLIVRQPGHVNQHNITARVATTSE